MRQTRADGIHESAKHCVNRLIALGLLRNEDDEKAVEVIKSFEENIVQRMFCGEFSD